jgi:hypothetical protein
MTFTICVVKKSWNLPSVEGVPLLEMRAVQGSRATTSGAALSLCQYLKYGKNEKRAHPSITPI